MTAVAACVEENAPLVTFQVKIFTRGAGVPGVAADPAAAAAVGGGGWPNLPDGEKMMLGQELPVHLTEDENVVGAGL